MLSLRMSSMNVSPCPSYSLHPSVEKQCQVLSTQLPQACPAWALPLPTALPPPASPHPFTCILTLSVELIFLTPALVLAALAQNFSPLWTSGRKSKLHILELQSPRDQPPTPPPASPHAQTPTPPECQVTANVLVSSNALTFPPPHLCSIPSPHWKRLLSAFKYT